MSDQPDLQALAATAQEVAAGWGVELGRPFALGRYSFVAPAGAGTVLKVTPAADDESDHEADALALWGGVGAVRLLRRDAARKALLAERAVPGDDLSRLPEEEATAIAVAVAQELWRPAGRPFRRVRDQVPRWLETAEAAGGDGVELIPLARQLFAELASGNETLVHGDFHHHNILRHGERYVAIDPKPYLGDREYDVPSFLWNPLQPETGRGSMPLERTRRRVAAFEAAGLDPWRIRAWTAIRGAYLGADESEAATIRALL